MIFYAGDDLCPVYIYKQYRRHRPAAANIRTSIFHLRIVNHNQNSDEVWYKAQTMGKNKLGTVVQEAAKVAHISGHKTGHSGRHTGLNALLHQQVPAQRVMQLSGHRNPNHCMNIPMLLWISKKKRPTFFQQKTVQFRPVLWPQLLNPMLNDQVLNLKVLNLKLWNLKVFNIQMFNLKVLCQQLPVLVTGHVCTAIQMSVKF